MVTRERDEPFVIVFFVGFGRPSSQAARGFATAAIALTRLPASDIYAF